MQRLRASFYFSGYSALRCVGNGSGNESCAERIRCWMSTRPRDRVVIDNAAESHRSNSVEEGAEVERRASSNITPQLRDHPLVSQYHSAGFATRTTSLLASCGVRRLLTHGAAKLRKFNVAPDQRSFSGMMRQTRS